MANPQKENGYVPIANELMEAMARLRLSGGEWSFIMALIRKTYGFNKKEDWITNSQIVILTGMRKERVSEAKRKLIEAKIVTEKRNKISLQKDYEKWRKLRKSVTIVTEKRNSELRKSVHTKDTITKDNNSEDKSSRGKKKDMFKPYKEPEIDLDSGEYIKEQSKTKNTDYRKVLDLFERAFGKRQLSWTTHKAQRQAAENLYTEQGLEKIEKALRFYKKSKDEKFCPQISSPFDLEAKWKKLQDFRDKQN